MKCNQCQEEAKLIFEPELICSQCLHKKIVSSKKGLQEANNLI